MGAVPVLDGDLDHLHADRKQQPGPDEKCTIHSLPEQDQSSQLSLVLKFGEVEQFVCVTICERIKVR